MQFFLFDNYEEQEGKKLPTDYEKDIYIPFNTGRQLTKKVRPTGRFSEERPSHIISLLNWINYHIQNGNISLGPRVIHIPIDYIPTQTGNTQNLNQFVIDPQGDIWFIDFLGNALLFTGGRYGACTILVDEDTEGLVDDCGLFLGICPSCDYGCLLLQDDEEILVDTEGFGLCVSLP